MVNTILTISAFITMLSIVIILIRFIKGPSTVDRIIAFDVMTIISLSLVGLISHFSARIIYLDIAIVYGLLSFLGVIIIAKYMEKGL